MSASHDEAINLLSLDGGGVRGVASLLILHEIMVKIKESRGLDQVPKPCDYFHMIGGTSTGGLIAIMLGRLRMSAEEALLEYDQCASKIFAFGNRKWTTATEKYRATALKEAVEDLVRRRNMGEYLRHYPPAADAKGQCFVCAMPANKVGQPRRFRSFAGDDGMEVKIWEAARATTAASFYFKPMPIRIGSFSTEDYIDAAIGCNNPVEYLLQEAAEQFGTGRRLGCLISIGTGTRLVSIARASSIMRSWRFVKELVGTLKNTATDGEEAHRRVQAKFGAHRNAYFRFNVPDAADQVGLDEYLKLGRLKALTAEYLAQPFVMDRVSDAADVLARNAADHGLTLGHSHGIDRDLLISSTQDVQPLGDVSCFFMARDDILDKLDAHFSPRDTKGKPRREFLLYGLGGVGKTQIALKAADNLEDRFKYIFHVDGSTVSTVNRSYANICQQYCDEYRHKESTGRAPVEEMRDAALSWMGELSDEWLVIYDNLPDQERLRPVLPRRNAGNVIYTSRSQGFLADLPAECVYEVQPLSEAAAVDLLLKIANREHLRGDEKEMEAVRETVTEAGCLPLAIETMGAILRKGDCTAHTFLHRFRDRRNRSALLGRPNPDGSSPARPTLYAVFDLSYDAILSLVRREGRCLLGLSALCALRVLNLLCFYHNEDIPIKMFEHAAEERLRFGSARECPLSDLADDPSMDASRLLTCIYPEKTWDRMFVECGLQLLQQFSLVRRSPRGLVSMHVLIQAWAQDRMDERTRCRQALAARIVLIESIKFSSKWLDDVWLRHLGPHLHACMAHEVAERSHDYEYDGLLSFKLGWFYHRQRYFPQAVDHLRRAAAMFKIEHGSHSKPATLALRILGNVYHDMGCVGDAESMYMEILDRLRFRLKEMVEESQKEMEEQFRKRTLVSEDGQRNRQARRQKIVHVLLQGVSTDQVARQVMATVEETDPKGDTNQPPAIVGMHNSVTRREDGPQIEGETVEQVREHVDAATKQGPSLPDTTYWILENGDVLRDLARLYFDSGRYDMGRVYLEDAIRAAKDVVEADDIDMLAWEAELALHSRNADRQYWLQRLQALQAPAALPPDQDPPDAEERHDYRAVLHEGIAEACIAYGDVEEAYLWYEMNLDMTRALYGPSDRKTLRQMRHLARCAVRLGRFEEAEDIARRAVNVAKTVYGRWHFETAASLDALLSVLFCLTPFRWPGSEIWNISQEACKSLRFTFGEGHPRAKELERWVERWRRRRAAAARDSAFAELDPTLAELAYNKLGEQIVDQAFANGVPKSIEEFKERATAAYREIERQRCQAEAKLSPEERFKHRRQLFAEAEMRVRARRAYEAEHEAAGTRAAELPQPSSRRRKWKERIIKLSPILEAAPECDNKIEGSWKGEQRQDVKGKGKALPLPAFENDEAVPKIEAGRTEPGSVLPR
ncbi:uncharacterized protein B0T15DRAFT_518680 [Chaetomium strumarium]|uniref:PNPLA domain-containing protein n=1 Tax=Chaetomium strumarium TaxID=1170767 RepID=A0AAJ0M647_9PEZI|nr:hypothetical protein B0T15DRAFT_518680 [Chaetomium strumarium]